MSFIEGTVTSLTCLRANCLRMNHFLPTSLVPATAAAVRLLCLSVCWEIVIEGSADAPPCLQGPNDASEKPSPQPLPRRSPRIHHRRHAANDTLVEGDLGLIASRRSEGSLTKGSGCAASRLLL